MTTYYKARRAHSMPNRFAMPAENMGEYEFGQNNNEPQRRRSAPARPQGKGGGLYPLKEEGHYAAVPRQNVAKPPLSYNYKKDRKPKVYSSYAVDSECKIHSKKLANQERDHGNAERKRSTSSVGSVGSVRSFRSSASPRRTVSASPSRASSIRSSQSPEPARRRNPGTTQQQKAPSSNLYSSNTAGYRYHNLKNSRFEENEEYEYMEQQNNNSNNSNNSNSSNNYFYNGYNGYSSFKGGKPGGNLSLEGLREPKFDFIDSMGILGLSNKMWNDTKKRQDSFLQSSQFIMRKNSKESYAM